MQIYSDVLSELSLRGAAQRHALDVTALEPLPHPKLAGTGWRLELARPDGTPATWHDYGYILAQLYAADPDMRARSARPSMSFDCASHFRDDTSAQFNPVLVMAGVDPVAVKSWRSVGWETVLPVAYGTVDVHFCGDGHIVAYAGRSDQGTITYAGTDWHVRVDLWEATGWSEAVPPGFSEHRTPISPYGPCRAFPTRGAPREEVRAAIAAVVTAAVRKYVGDHPDVLLRADITRLEHELPEASRAAAEAYAEYTRLNLIMSDMTSRLQAAQAALAGSPC